MNATMTLIAGEEFSQQPEVQLYLQTLRDHVPNADHFVVAMNLSKETCDKIAHMGHKVAIMHCQHTFARWVCYHRILCQQHYEYVLVTDAKDVFFQDDPFQYTNNYKLILCGEGMQYKKCDWNTHWQNQLDGIMAFEPIDYSEEEVINSGFELGTHEQILKLCSLMWSNFQALNKAPERLVIPDQAILSWLYHHFLRYEPGVIKCSPTTASLVATGQAIAADATMSGYEVDWQNGNLVHPQLMRPYAVVHQWERTKYKDLCLSKLKTA